MGHYDPIQDRIDTRKDVELEHLRAACNSLASERDLLVIERDNAVRDRARALQGAANLLAVNRQLSDHLKRALRVPERSAA